MSTTALNTRTIEDWLLALTPLVTALAGFQWGGLIPGTTGFLVGVFLGAFAKFLIGFSQNPHLSNWEDFVPLVAVFLTFIATAFTSNPQFLTYGTILGFIVKALGYFQKGGTSTLVEDGFLIVGAFLSLYGASVGNAQLTNAGFLLSLLGKALPSLGGATKLAPASPPATP